MFAFFVILIPILGGVGCYWLGTINVTLRDKMVVALTGLTCFLTLAMYGMIQGVDSITVSYPFLLPPFGLSFRFDWLSVVLASITSIIWLLVTIYSFDYMKHLENTNRYHAFTLITLGATLGTLLSGDLLTLFLFFELMSLASFVLVIHEGSPGAMKAGQLYLVMTIAGGLALFFGIIAVFEISGSVAFLNSGVLSVDSSLSLAAFIAFLVGFGMKAGMFPVHVWLPEAHPVAPSPSSALLSGVMLKIGAFGLLRVMHNIYDIQFLGEVGWNTILLVLASITIIIGSIFAILQDNLKRRLAYSSVGQMGYILLGMALLSEKALVGDIFHIFAHAIMKSCLFLAAGALIMQTGKKNISELAGIGRKMPVTMVSFSMAALAMIGIPPFNGFLSKWLLGLGALESGKPAYAILLLVSSLLNSIYYMPIIINAFFRKEETDFSHVKEVSYRMLVPIIILAACTVIFDLIPLNIPLSLSRITASFLFRGGPGI